MVAPTIIGTVDFMVVQSFGAECGLTPFEKGVMTPSLQRTLARAPKGAIDRAAPIVDLTVLVTCALFWMRRIAKIQDNKAKEKYAIEPMEQARADGVVGTAFSVQSPATQQQTVNGQQHANGAQPRANNVPPVAATPPPPASAYGVPSMIRESFASDQF